MSACIANAQTPGFIDSGVANVSLIAGWEFHKHSGASFLTCLSVLHVMAGLCGLHPIMSGIHTLMPSQQALFLRCHGLSVMKCMSSRMGLVVIQVILTCGLLPTL